MQVDNERISQQLKISNEKIKSMREAIMTLDKDTRNTLDVTYHKIVDDNPIIKLQKDKKS